MMGNPENVLFILNSLTFGGAERFAVTLLKALDRREISPSLLYLQKKEDLLDELDKSKIRSITCYGGTNGPAVGLAFRIAQVIERESINTVFCINQRPMLYAFLARRFSGRKFRILQAIHVNALVTGYQKLKNFLLYRPLFNRCDSVIFVSQAQRRYWTSECFMSPHISECIHNGIDIEYFSDKYSREARAELRHRTGFSEGAYVVGMSGRLHSGKNHAELIGAVKALRMKGIDAKALIIGDGPERNRLETLVKSQAMWGHAVITGFKKDVRPFISICDCIALTSRAEAFPLSVIEGMAMGKPVVASEVGGTSEQIEHGVTGFLYKIGDQEELAIRLAILSNPEVAAQMGRMARKAAIRKFSLASMVDKYTRILIGV